MIAFLRNLILQDVLLKLFSLTLALLIWLTISFAIQRQGTLAPTGERTFFSLPILVVSSAEDVRMARVTPKEVDVTVQGDPKTLQNLQSKDIRVIVDLTGIEAARYLQKRIEVSTPAGVTHSRVVPEEVQISFPGK